MTVLPEPPAATTAGQAAIDDQAQQLLAAIEDAMRTPTSYRDTAPIPVVGATPPVAQPGRPPMSQKATDASALMLSGSVLTATLGGAATAILWASGHADPTVIALVFGAPAGLILAIARLLRRAGEAAPPVHHHHYAGPVHQQTTHSHTRGVWAKNTNTQ